MAVEKALFLALLVGLILLGQSVAFAQKGKGVGASQTVAVPSVNLGPATAPGLRTSVGLPAGALAAPGASRSASSAGLLPPGAAQSKSSAGLTPPGATRSAASAGTAPAANSNRASSGSSDEKTAGEGKEKLASSATASSGAALSREERLSQLPTCR